MTDSKPMQSAPAQTQSSQPGKETEMHPLPETEPKFKGSDKLRGKVALITGGDSGIGRAVARAFAREGANVAIVYLNETEDALETKQMVEQEGVECLLLEGDITSEKFCQESVRAAIEKFGRVNILVNNAAEQHERDSITEISAAQLERTFKTNLFAQFYFVKATLPQMQHGDSIINTTSVTAFKGNETLLDYSSTKGAIVAFTRSLSEQVVGDGVRVNAIAPGPIWTPLIPASFDAEHVAEFGKNTPMKRPGQPNEVAPAYVLLASEEGSYISGQIIHINGGTIVG